MKYFSLITPVFLFFYSNDIFSQWTDYRIYPSAVTQTEVLAVVHPMDKDLIFVSANSINFEPFFLSEGIYVTSNGGSSWYGSDTCNGQYESYHYGDPGIAIDKNGRFILTRFGRSPFYGLYSHYSTDNGRNWSLQKRITEEDLERASVTSDASSISQHYGRTYAAWVKFAPPYPIDFSYTDNGAESWSTPVSINNPPQRCAGGEIFTDKNGKIYICWAGVTDVSPFTENYVGFASSSDGGSTWSVKENAFPMNGIQGLLPQKGNIRVNGYPRIAVDTSEGIRNGWIYIITTQKNMDPAGTDPDIILNYSTDSGNSWSDGIRVNKDPINNGKIQYFPAINVDNTGGINILYYDDRYTTSDSAGVNLSRSADGGQSWEEYIISSHNFKPQPIGGLGQGYQGDNISIVSANNFLFPFWMDNSSGIYQIWTTSIDLSLLDTENEATPNELSFRLLQNYPNPFNPATTLKITVPELCFVSVKVYDLRGQELATIIGKELPAGDYEYDFDGSTLSSGIYFCRAVAGKYSSVKKMILLK